MWDSRSLSLGERGPEPANDQRTERVRVSGRASGRARRRARARAVRVRVRVRVRTGGVGAGVCDPVFDLDCEVFGEAEPDARWDVIQGDGDEFSDLFGGAAEDDDAVEDAGPGGEGETGGGEGFEREGFAEACGWWGWWGLRACVRESATMVIKHGHHQAWSSSSMVIVQYLPQMPVKTPGGRSWRIAHSASETGRAHVGRVQYHPPMNMLLTARQVHTITAEPSLSPPVCRTKP